MHIRICQVIVSFTTSSAHKIICRQNYALCKVLNCWYTTLKLIIANGATLCLCYFTFQCLVQYRVHWINQWCTSKTEPIQSHLVYNPSQLSELNSLLSCQSSIENYQFHKIYHGLNLICKQTDQINKISNRILTGLVALEVQWIPHTHTHSPPSC